MPEQQFVDNSQEWSRLFKPSSVYGLQAQVKIKVFHFVSRRKPQSFLSAYCSWGLSQRCCLHSSQYLAEVDDAVI